MKTPEEMWIEYRDFVYQFDLEEGNETERQRAFFAGSEAVFQLMESCGWEARPGILQRYREANKAAALQTIPLEERE